MVISFDFDSTLSLPKVQKYAKQLVQNGHTVLIITSRFDDEMLKVKGFQNRQSNEIVYQVAQKVGIPLENIYFSNMDLKVKVVQKLDKVPDIHFDDDYIEEIALKNKFPKMVVINPWDKNWTEEANAVVGKVDRKSFLTEANLEAKLAKFQNKFVNGGKIKQEKFDKLLQTDPSKEKIFLEWLVKMYLTKKVKEEDLYKVKKDLQSYYYYRNKANTNLQKDINFYKTPDELFLAIRTLPPIKGLADDDSSIQSANEKAKKNAYKFNVDKWIVVAPQTKQASCFYGKNTRWCTAATDEEGNEFENYFVKDDKWKWLWVLIDKNDGEKLQFYFPESEYMNAEDRRIDIFYFFTKNIALLDFFDKQFNFSNIVSSDRINVIKENDSYVVKLTQKSDELLSFFSEFLDSHILDTEDWNEDISILDIVGWFPKEVTNYIVEKYNLEDSYDETLKDFFEENSTLEYDLKDLAYEFYTPASHTYYTAIINKLKSILETTDFDINYQNKKSELNFKINKNKFLSSIIYWLEYEQNEDFLTSLIREGNNGENEIEIKDPSYGWESAFDGRGFGKKIKEEYQKLF